MEEVSYMPKRGKYGQGRVYQPTYKAADGTVKTVSKFYIQYYDKNGNQHRDSTDASTAQEARKVLNTRLYEVEQGTAPTVDSKSLQYGDLRAALLTHYATNKMKSLDILSGTGEQTIRGLTKLDEFFGFEIKQDKSLSKGMKVKDINNGMWVSGFIEARRKEGVSDATIRNSGALLRQMFQVAASPEFKLLNPSQTPTFTMPKAPKSKTDFATKEEFEKLLQYLDDRFHPYATFLFYQATRKTEAANILWGQINLAEAMYYPNADANKTGDDTPRPLTNKVVKVLRTLKPGKSDAVVFSAHSEKAFQKAFRKACYEFGLGRDAWQCGQCKFVKDAPAPKDGDPAIVCEACKKRSKGTLLIPMQFHYVGLTIHGLRRSTVVFYREAGLADSEVMAVTGHKTNKTFLGYSVTRIASMRKRLDSATEDRARFMAQQQRKQLTA
jgi:integrase